MWGMRLNAIWWGKCAGVIASPRAQARVWLRSSSTPLTPAPDTAWKLVAITRRSRPASWSGFSGITVTMVVQLGHATMPRCPFTRWPLISGTTRGTVGSMRKALDLSTTTAPALTACGAYSLDCAEPAEKNATSTPRKASGPTCSTRIFSPLKVTLFPTDRSEANARSSRTGNLRSSRIFSVVCPTAPVAPTTASFIVFSSSLSTTVRLRGRSGRPSPSCPRASSPPSGCRASDAPAPAP